jgi:hypothetical protein
MVVIKRGLDSGSLMMRIFRVGSMGTQLFYGVPGTVSSSFYPFILMCIAGVGKTYLA